MALKNNLFVPASISDIRDVPTQAALFEVDSNYGHWPETVAAKDSHFVIGGRDMQTMAVLRGSRIMPIVTPSGAITCTPDRAPAQMLPCAVYIAAHAVGRRGCSTL